MVLAFVNSVKKINVKNVGRNHYFVLIVINSVGKIKTIIGHIMVQILEMVDVKLVHMNYVLTVIIIYTNVKAVNYRFLINILDLNIIKME